MNILNLKKAISILLATVLTVALFSFFGYAGDLSTATSNTYTVTTKDGKKNLINNEYYSTYCDRIFEAEAESLSLFSLNGMTETTVSNMTDEAAYVTVILKNIENQDYYTYNTSTLKEYQIVYAGRTTPLSVVKITKTQAEEILNSKKTDGIFPAFFSAAPLTSALLGTAVMGDADCSSKITAADARKVLRFSAGLEAVKDSEAKKFYFTSDLNYDNKVNSVDARLILRTAAGLEEISEISLPYASYWKDF